MKHVNSQLQNSFAKLTSFPGVTLKHLRYYIVPSLIDEIPVRIILHGGCNDVNNKSSTPEKIANEIADMAILCRDYGVNNNVLKNLRSKNSNKVIIGHININSLRNKFELITEMVRDKVDLLMISETKLYSSFPNAQFYMKSNWKPYRLDRNGKGGGIILYVREDVTSKLINSSCTNHDKEYLLVELNLRKQKWLIICNYNPHKTRIKGYLECISKEIDSHSSKYDNFLLLGDFNSELTEEAMKGFCQIYNFKNLLDKPTCHKTSTNPSCVDLILTNRPRNFQNSCTFETGLSDFPKMTLTVLKSSFAKKKPRILNHRNYKFFNNTLFRDQVLK